MTVPGRKPAKDSTCYSIPITGREPEGLRIVNKRKYLLSGLIIKINRINVVSLWSHQICVKISLTFPPSQSNDPRTRVGGLSLQMGPLRPQVGLSTTRQSIKQTMEVFSHNS